MMAVFCSSKQGRHRRIGCVGNERDGFGMRKTAELAKKAGMMKMKMKRWRGRSVCLRTAETANNKACEESDHDRARSGDGCTRKGFGAESSELVYERAWRWTRAAVISRAPVFVGVGAPNYWMMGFSWWRCRCEGGRVACRALRRVWC